MIEELSFAQLLEETYAKPASLAPGQKVSAIVVRISKEWVFIDLGGKSEGYFALNEVTGSDGVITIKEGDPVTAYFLGSGKGGMQFTTRLGKGSEANAHLEEAYRGGIPVEGLVESEIKGGYAIPAVTTILQQRVSFAIGSLLQISNNSGEAKNGKITIFQGGRLLR